MAFSSLDESLCAKLSPTLGFFQCSWSEMVGNRLSKASRLKGRRWSQSLKIKVQRFISENFKFRSDIQESHRENCNVGEAVVQFLH